MKQTSLIQRSIQTDRDKRHCKQRHRSKRLAWMANADWEREHTLHAGAQRMSLPKTTYVLTSHDRSPSSGTNRAALDTQRRCGRTSTSPWSSEIASTTSWTTQNSKLGVSLEAATRRHVFVDIHPTALMSVDELIKKHSQTWDDTTQQTCRQTPQ